MEVVLKMPPKGGTHCEQRKVVLGQAYLRGSVNSETDRIRKESRTEIVSQLHILQFFKKQQMYRENNFQRMYLVATNGKQNKYNHTHSQCFSEFSFFFHFTDFLSEAIIRF